MSARRGKLWFVATLLLLASACLTPTQRRKDALGREARMFNDDLRWGRYEAMSEALSREESQRLLTRAGAVGDDLMMADYEVMSIIFAPDSNAATVVARFDWYRRSQTNLQSTTLEQRWEHRDGRWLVVKQRRTRGDRFPLVTEPATTPAAAAAPP